MVTLLLCTETGIKIFHSPQSEELQSQVQSHRAVLTAVSTETLALDLLLESGSYPAPHA